MPTILITGAASGLGHAFLTSYLDQPNTTLHALDRHALPPSTPSPPNLHAHIIDITSPAALAAFTTAHFPPTAPLDLLIHSAGVRGLVPTAAAASSSHRGDVAACESWDVMDLETLVETFRVNAAGTFMVVQALMPNLRVAAAAAAAAGSIPKVVVMSSRLGSVGRNERATAGAAAGGAYAYRASKAACNAMVRSFAVDVPEVVFVLCHPGRVRTGLVGWVEEGAGSVEESVRGLVPLIERWGKEDSGRFYDRFGEVISW